MGLRREKGATRTAAARAFRGMGYDEFGRAIFSAVMPRESGPSSIPEADRLEL
jgi:hypothetical protein